jgi:uncharacterized protein YdeI (YjbR/CyaY-like superfamily)
MTSMNPDVDFFFTKAKAWRAEYIELRKLILSCGLTEELKWGKPCYTLDGQNVVLIHGFKDYCALLFMKGALMTDAHGILIQQTEHVQSARQIRFTNVEDIAAQKPILKAYVTEAIALEKAGAKVEFKKALAPFPAEMQDIFNKSPALKKAFEALTPGRQRGYILYFSAAKQAKTRATRVGKEAPRILAGLGLDD